jgi:membrane protein
MFLTNAFQLFKETLKAWSDDYASSMGAALSYYTLFSIAPLLLIVIAIAGLIFGPDAARGEILEQLSDLMGEEGARAVEGLLASASEPATSVPALLFGLGVLFFGATTVFAELQDAFDRVWRVPGREPPGGFLALVRGRLLSFGMMLGIAFLLMVSLVVTAALAALDKWWGARFGGWETLLQITNFVLSFALITGLFALIYKIMPRIRVEWRDVRVGAALTALLFVIGKSLIGLYIGKSGIASGFGAAASLVVLLVWVYYSVQIFLLGAEFTWVYAYKVGSKCDRPIGRRREARRGTRQSS